MKWYLILVMVIFPGDLGVQKVFGPYDDLETCQKAEREAEEEFKKVHGTTTNVYLVSRCTQERK